MHRGRNLLSDDAGAREWLITLAAGTIHVTPDRIAEMGWQGVRTGAGLAAGPARAAHSASGLRHAAPDALITPSTGPAVAKRARIEVGDLMSTRADSPWRLRR